MAGGSEIAASAAPMLTTALGMAAVAVVGLALLHREGLRRALLRAVDPRPLAAVRVLFGLCLLLGSLEVMPLHEYVFSDEGLTPSAAVPQVHGRAALAGYGDGVRQPAGFDGAWSVIRYVTSGRWSLLHFWDSPGFVRGYFLLFVLACGAMIAGWRTRAATAATWLLLVGMLRRGDAHWGGEQVYCGFLVLLVFARAGEAWSVDNWLRCRRLRRRGLLSEAGGPGDGAGAAPGPGRPQGLAAIYRRVPAWPQLLIAAQLAICYVANGWAKSGEMWESGEAMVYVLHLDRHVRADFHGVVLALGAWPLKLATLAVLWWERLFPLVLIGLWLRAAAEVGAPRCERPRLARACWTLLAAALVIGAALPGASIKGEGDAAGASRAAVFGAGALAILIALVMAGRTVRVRGVTIDRGWFARWPLGVGLWLGFGALFHLLNFLTLNVGMFAVATLAVYPVCGLQAATVRAGQRIFRGLGRLGLPVPEHMRRDTAVAAEDPTLPQLWRDDARLPGSALAAACGLVAAGGVVAVAREEVAWWHASWLVSAAGLIIWGRRVARGAGGAADVREPWAYGPALRLGAGGFAVYHLVGLLVWQLPPWPALPHRDAARGLVEPWFDVAFTRQAWAMFSPNVARANLALRTIVVDAAGTEHDLRTELEHPENLVRPYLLHDRWRKIDEGVLGGRGGMARWHARWVCRRWALEHDGEAAREVRLMTVRARIEPWDEADPAERFWQTAKVTTTVSVECAHEPFAQLDDEVRARHGLAPAPAGSLEYEWPAKPPRHDPWTPLWWALAGGLGLAVAAGVREDRRRRVGARGQ
jgi:hypothetical protein